MTTPKPCPTRGGEVPLDTVWIRHLRFFCCEECCREAPTIVMTTTRRT